MKAFYHAPSSSFKTVAALLTSLILGLVCASAFGHEWTINGKKVNAKAVDFNGSHVLLEDKKGRQKSVAINDLEESDLQYLSNLIAIHNAKIQQRLAEEQIRQQQLALTAEFLDIWTVRMMAPDGSNVWQNYFAANSLQAKELAWRDFPNARINSVQRMRRAGQNNGGGIGFAPVIQTFPNGIRLPIRR